MNPIVVKVAPKGEGKTKWLMNIAKKYHDNDIPVYLVTSNEHDYVNFCRKYFSLYSQACRVKLYEHGEPLEGSVILIDDIIHQNIHSDDILTMTKHCHKMFVTIEGICYHEEDSTEELTVDGFFEQLKLC